MTVGRLSVDPQGLNVVDPIGPATASYKIMRGSSFMTTAELVTCAERYLANVPTNYFGDMGVRTVLPVR